MKATKTLLGRVPVDSGALCIVDPCYLIPHEGHNPLTLDEWEKIIPVASNCGFRFSDSDGTGRIFSDFGGDGIYSIYAHKDKTGRVVRVTIEFPEQ